MKINRGTRIKFGLAYPLHDDKEGHLLRYHVELIEASYSLTQSTQCEDTQHVKRGSIKSHPFISCLVSFTLNYCLFFFIWLSLFRLCPYFFHEFFSLFNAFIHWWKLIFHASYWLTRGGSKWLSGFFCFPILLPLFIPTPSLMKRHGFWPLLFHLVI